MNRSVTFVTTNPIKFQVASESLRDYRLEQYEMDLQEIQSNDGQAIVLHKAEQAYAQLKKPIIVSDDTWDFPGLNGFPGPYMKDMNAWFTAEDFLHLTKSLKDRRVFLWQHVAYQDEYGKQYFVGSIEAMLLPEIRGNNDRFTHGTIISFDGGKHSSAEMMAQGKTSIVPGTKTVWNDVQEWLTSH